METAGGLDHETETVAHCVTDCKFIEHPFSLIRECFHVDIASLFNTNTQATLTTPHGVLAYSAVHVSWLIRSAVKKQQAATPPWTSFLSNWCSYLAKWATATHCLITTDHLTLFCHTLEVYLDKLYVPPITLSQHPPPPPPTVAQRKATNRKCCKLQRAEELESELHDLREQGYLLVFSDGSLHDEPGEGRIATYGIATESGHRIAKLNACAPPSD